ncbi:MAG: hypothetical protein RIA69_06205 [Cyclobacteriaceae bacterium]
MKTNLLVIAFLSLFFTLSAQDQAKKISENHLKKYPIEKGSVTYTITGDATGDAFRTFDDFGIRDRFISNVEINKYGTVDRTNTTVLSLGDYSYSVKNDDLKGKKLKDSRLMDLLKYKSPRESIDAVMIADGGTKAGTKVILDKKCTKWVFDTGITTEIYEWNGLVLKIVKELPGIKYQIVAKELTENPEISDDFFKVSAKVKFTEY